MTKREMGEPEQASAQVIDSQLRAFGRRRAADDYELGRWLLAGFRQRVHEELGLGSFREYTERLFGFSGRATEERLRTAAALEALPSLTGIFASGSLVFSVMRELSRVATAETEAEWIAWVMGKTAREVEAEVSGLGKGARPGERKTSDPRPKRVTLRLSPRSHALFTELRRALDDDPEEPLSDDALVEALASRVIRPSSWSGAHVGIDAVTAHMRADGAAAEEGADGDTAHMRVDEVTAHVGVDAGQPNYQLALIVCEHCREGKLADGEPVDALVLERAACDAVVLGRVDAAGVAPRATRSIPPRIRRQVVARHGGCCAVPGCRHRAFKDVHHIDLRSEGGSHDPERLVLLCSQHHQRAHEGGLVIEGMYSTGFVFRHPDGSAYGSPEVDAAKAALMKQVFGFLVGLEFPHAEARAMCEAAKDGIAVDADIGDAVKKALSYAVIPGSTSYSPSHEGSPKQDGVAEATVPYGVWLNSVSPTSLPPCCGGLMRARRAKDGRV